MSAGGDLALLKACAIGAMPMVRQLLQRSSADVNAVRTSDGATAIIVACNRWHMSDEMVELLLEHGARPDTLTRAGKTPLILACERGRTRAARHLLDHHADANVHKPSTGTTALICACKNNYVDLVTLLLDRGADVNLAAKGGVTALMVAAKDGLLKTARLLIDRGASLDIQSAEGATALLIACTAKKSSIAELLIERGANLNLQDKGGCTPLMLASKLGPLSTVKLLVNRGADMNLQCTYFGSTALIQACKKRNITIASFLTKRGADLNIFDRDSLDGGKTVLMYECMWGVKKNFAKLLLDRGAKITIGNKSALFGACSSGNMEMVDFLLKRGAEIDAQDHRGRTGLMMACTRAQDSSHNCVKLLLDRGADVSVRSQMGLTALMLASREGTGASLNLLLEHNGAMINEQSDYGSTALMYTYRSNFSDRGATQALLARGANTNIQRQDGSTALMLASLYCWNEKIAEQLLDAGADPNLQKRDGMTALMIQCVHHHYRSRIPQVQLLIRHGADLGLRDSWGWSALEFVLDNRLYFDDSGRLLSRCADRILLKDKFVAAKMELAGLLVSAGAPLDFSHVPSVKAQAALTIASRNGYLEVLQVLSLRNSHRTFPNVESLRRKSNFSASPAGPAKHRRLAK